MTFAAARVSAAPDAVPVTYHDSLSCSGDIW
jgi:hypothetical protein